MYPGSVHLILINPPLRVRLANTMMARRSFLRVPLAPCSHCVCQHSHMPPGTKTTPWVARNGDIASPSQTMAPNSLPSHIVYERAFCGRRVTYPPKSFMTQVVVVGYRVKKHTLLRGRDGGETSEAESWCEKSPQSNMMSSQKSAKRRGEMVNTTSHMPKRMYMRNSNRPGTNVDVSRQTTFAAQYVFSLHKRVVCLE
jgi:hypothetical protein